MMVVIVYTQSNGLTFTTEPFSDDKVYGYMHALRATRLDDWSWVLPSGTKANVYLPPTR